MALIRRALFSLAWGVAWSCDVAGRAVTYAAAGALTRDELRAAIAQGWEHYGVDEAFVLSGLQPWEAELFDRVLRPGDRILVVGCGTGRDLIALLRRGHRVEGLEPAGGPLAIARRMLDKLELRAVLRQGDVETSELGGAFDVVVFSPFCYGYIPESRARVAALAKAKRALEPGGRIVVAYTPVRDRRTPLIRLTRLVSRLARSDWTPEPGDTLWVSRGAGPVVQFDHEFEPAELEAEARSAALRVLVHRRHEGSSEGICVLTALD